MKRKLLAAAVAAAMVFSMPMAVSASWQQDAQGSWQWVENGVHQTGWKQIEGKWYYFSSGGKMQTGWLKDSGSWYYLDASGAMKTGWQMISGEWYYLNEDGKMAINIEKDGYIINSIGVATRQDKNFYMYSDLLTYSYFYDDELIGQEITCNEGGMLGVRYRYNYNQEKAEGYQKYIEDLGFTIYGLYNYDDGTYLHGYMSESRKESVILGYNNFRIPYFDIEVLTFK